MNSRRPVDPAVLRGRTPSDLEGSTTSHRERSAPFKELTSFFGNERKLACTAASEPSPSSSRNRAGPGQPDQRHPERARRGRHRQDGTALPAQGLHIISLIVHATTDENGSLTESWRPGGSAGEVGPDQSIEGKDQMITDFIDDGKIERLLTESKNPSRQRVEN